MIDVKDLRVGNLVNVVGIGDVKVSHLSSMGVYKDLRPIPLTEEWFLKFGLIKLRSPLLSFVMGCYEISIIPTHNEFGVYIPSGRIITKIKYVHQLQNLYFALTGEELELKEAKDEN